MELPGGKKSGGGGEKKLASKAPPPAAEATPRSSAPPKKAQGVSSKVGCCRRLLVPAEAAMFKRVCVCVQPSAGPAKKNKMASAAAGKPRKAADGRDVVESELAVSVCTR